MELARIAARGAAPQLSRDPIETVSDADVIYTDVWTSMGQEEETGTRRSTFQAFQVNEALLAHAKPDALVMHPMPVRRNLEVTDEVLDGPRSLILVQAENRLHTQKGLLSLLLRQ